MRPRIGAHRPITRKSLRSNADRPVARRLRSSQQVATVSPYPVPAIPPPLRFVFAVAAVAAVVTIDRSSGTLVDDGSQFLLMATAVMASAWFGGLGPALLATVVGAVAADRGPTAADASAANMHLALFVVHSLLVTTVMSEMRRAREVAEHQAREAHSARLAGDAANRMKDEFLATISHELRTPLNAVLGWVHLIRSGRLDPPTERRGLQSIERNVRLQAQITGDLLDLSKSLTGRLHVDSRPVALADAVRQATASAEPAAFAKRVDIAADLPERPAVVLGDALRLRQVVWHLLANAIKFTPRGGKVHVSIESLPEVARLVVRDSGPGIDPAFLPRAFDRFSQADPSTTRIAGGLGVGLSLVRELVELHGGEIVAANGEGGVGAVFTATFPLHAVASPERRPEMEPRVSAGPPLDGLRVLVFEEDADGREVLESVLQQRGALVRAVESFADALEALEGWHPDVLVSEGPHDASESYRVCSKVQALDSERGGRIPALALTRFPRTDERVRELLGANLSDLPKPIEPTLLTAEIARLAGRERRRIQR